KLDHLLTNAGVPAGKDVRATHHERAHHVSRQRFADAGGVGEDEVELEAIEIRSIDPHFGEGAETGVDAVGGLVALGELLHEVTGGTDAFAGFVGDRHPCATSDADDVVDGERASGEYDLRLHGDLL